MKNVLITGCFGFICSNFTNYLVKKYPHLNFFGLDILDYVTKKENIDVLDFPNFKFLYGNIKNYETIYFYLKEYNIDTLISLAAQTHVDNSYNNSLEFTLTNVYGTHVLLEASRKWGKIEKFIHMSTDEVYGTILGDSVDENAVFNPTNSYASSKAGAEMILYAYGHSYKFPYVIVRCNNVYGSRQFNEKLIPRFICNLLNNRKLQIQGTGKQTRTFVYVDDVCKALDTILMKGEIGKIYNIGSNDEISVYDFAHKIISMMKPELSADDKKDERDKLIEYIKDRDFNDLRYSVDCTRLKNLGWNVETNFDDGLRQTIKWYTDNLHLYE